MNVDEMKKLFNQAPKFQAQSAPYQTTTTTYQATNPPYQPTVSAYQPTVSPYQPTISPYQPTITAYQPTIPPYQPTVAPYQPTIPPFDQNDADRQPKKVDNNASLKSQSINNAAAPAEEDKTEETTTEYVTISPELVSNGQYHEVNPGQYYEDSPGQYHEDNPGQYHEVHPGQYHERHPGQYHEVNPGQDLVVDNIEVDVNNSEDDTRIYNIQANAGEFVVGEVGEINNGQILAGVRYTLAGDGVIDAQRLAEILEGFGFGQKISS